MHTRANHAAELETIRTASIDANGLTFGLLEAGDGPLALCLHGFPDCAWTWRHILPTLASAGYHAVAPFMRGYAPTSIPTDGIYQTAALATDANRLHDRLHGNEDAVIIGHDWGAAAAYLAAIAEPHRWRRVVTAAVPPPSAFRAELRRYSQLRRSWYMYFFLHPTALQIATHDDLALLDRLWADWSPRYDPADDLPRVKAALRDPANLAAALNYYRASLCDGFRDPSLEALQERATEPIPRPTLYLHGTEDGCIGIEAAWRAPAHLVEGSRVDLLEGVGHFPHLEQRAEFGRRVLDFLNAD